jgi:IclR family KDG regulon transcriptional repressor
MGKMLLSTLEDGDLRELYKDNRFEVFTDRTIKNIDELLEDVSKIRTRGYATDIAEFAPSIGCLAVPVYQGDKAVAALSVTTNVALLTDDFIEVHLELLRKASAEATRRMGGALSTSPF